MSTSEHARKYEPAELLDLISERYRAGKSSAAIARDLGLTYRGVRRLIERAQSDGLLPEPAPAEPERTADWVAVPMGSYRAPADQLAIVAAGRDAGKTPQQIAKENGWRLARVLVLLSEIPERYVTTPIEPRPGVVYAPVVDVEPVALEPLGLEPRREPRRAEQPKHEPLGDDVLTTTACRRMPGGRWHHGPRRAKRKGGPPKNHRSLVDFRERQPGKLDPEMAAVRDLLRDPRHRARQEYYRALRYAVRHARA